MASPPFPRKILSIDTLDDEDVYCLAVINYQDSCSIVTGHGNGKVKLWNKDGTLKESITLPIRDDVTCICATPTLLAVSVSNAIVLYNIKKQQLSEPLEVCKYNVDEINQLRINSSGNYLLSCDDSGQTAVIDISIPKRSNHRTTCRYHDMCLTAAFHPQRCWEMITGGMDSHIVLWEYSRGRPLHTLDIKESLQTSFGLQYINPPMIYSLCTLDNKPLVAAGLGNGCISLLSISGGKIRLLSTIQRHSTSVGSVISYTLKEPFEIPSVGMCTDVIVSGGNDSNIILSPVVKALPVGPNGMSGMDVPVHSLGPEPLHVIHHGSKVNWMERLDGWSYQEEECNCAVGVADQTSIVTLYLF